MNIFFVHMLMQKFSILKRSIKFWFQRLFRGWDDRETWNLSTSLSVLILPRLKRFKEITIGYPSEFSSMQEWHQNLDFMIEAFEFYASEDHFLCEDVNKIKKAQEGIELFASYYSYLWW